ncbi:hypothetical protein FACS1894216_17850 [Synergistales bacterium]|nr:hypothetical protein FACS1894216_17850 [Synergistales bacterium]
MRRILRKIKYVVRYILTCLRIIPPFVNIWSGDYATWEDALLNSKGYDERSIFEKVLKASISVRDGEAVYERDSVLFDQIEYSWPLLAGLMWGAAIHARGGGMFAHY